MSWCAEVLTPLIRKLSNTFFVGVALCCTVSSRADEGMWTYDNVPASQIEQKYGFRPDAKWLEHVMKSSVRFNSGGSGSFVSSSGLVLTNHHIAMDTLAKLSDEKHNYVRDGYAAR